jgi:triacylglycerol lipase
VLACGVVFGWRQPFGSRRMPDGTDAAQIDRQRRGVVLIHGFVCNRGLWLRWQQAFTAQRRAHIALNLEPAFGSIDDYVPLIEAAVQRLTQLTGRAPVLVCHSMGGLAARAWLRSVSPVGTQDHRVHQVLTLGTPHQGTWLGQWGHTTNGRQMRLDSPWLQALAAAEPSARGSRFVCWYSHCDNIVFPVLSATLPGAALHHIESVGHVAMVDDLRVVAGVQAVLDKADHPAA